jgi:hypothetical protein
MRGFYTGEGARPSVDPIDRSLSIELPPSPVDPDAAACCAPRWGFVQLRNPASLLQSFTFERTIFCEALSDLVQNAESSVRIRGPLVVPESDLDRLAPHQMVFESDPGAAFGSARAQEAIRRCLTSARPTSGSYGLGLPCEAALGDSGSGARGRLSLLDVLLEFSEVRDPDTLSGQEADARRIPLLHGLAARLPREDLVARRRYDLGDQLSRHPDELPEPPQLRTAQSTPLFQ